LGFVQQAAARIAPSRVPHNQAPPGLIATGHFLRPIGARSMSALGHKQTQRHHLG
jgi:hypothetical protein